MKFWEAVFLESGDSPCRSFLLVTALRELYARGIVRKRAPKRLHNFRAV
jgi:hypothetical protein